MPEKLQADVSHKVKKIEVFTKRLVSTKLMGNYKSSIKGRGLDFNNFREYTVTDDASLIDWKVSVRVNKPVIKEFIEERNLEVFLLIDVSSSMVFGSTEKLKNEYVTELASTLSYAILNVGDSLGYGFLSDKLTDIVIPKVNRNLYYKLSRSLVNPEIYGGGYDLEKALKKCIEILKRNSVLIIISDFIGLKGDWEESLKKASHKLDVIGIMVRDPRDKEIPENSNMIVIEDPFTSKQIILDPSTEVREKYRKFVDKEEREISEAFYKAHAGLLKLTTDQPFMVPLINFFKRRKK
ncbi:MAG: DUF58 domain-containing protein [Nanoarchaeota archaeon]|mgnify:CR=1 FL=1